MVKRRRQQTPEKDRLPYHELKDQLKSAQDENAILKAEIESLKSLIDKSKIHFADTILALSSGVPMSLGASQPLTYAEAIANRKQPERKAVLVVEKLQGSEQVLDSANVDFILQSGKGGPTVQHVSVKDNRVVMTFNSDSDREKAKSILESCDETKDRIKVIPTAKRSFPVVALYTGKSDLELMKKELEFRNPILCGCIDYIRPLSQSSEHVKLFLSTKECYLATLKKGRLYIKDPTTAAFTSHRVVECDPNREVRRCFRCQAYGHVAAKCNRAECCGYCASSHLSTLCKVSRDPAKHTCSNCKGSHQSGHSSCPYQIRAVERYKRMFDI